MTKSFLQSDYRCPGEASAISRAVHLTRLADGYPACRQCPHRHEVEGLSSRLAKRAASVRPAPGLADWFHEEGVGGGLYEGFDADLVGRLAAAFGTYLRSQRAEDRGNPALVLAGDGRPWTQELIARAAERLQWAACDLVELGSSSSPALAWAVAQSRADGGFFVGNPSGRTHAAGVKFFLSDARPVSAGNVLSAVRRAVEQPPRRPARRHGSTRRLDVATSYFERFVESFHGLRPLRFAIETTCRPLAATVDRLLENTACRVVAPDAAGAPAKTQARTQAHFSIAVDDDGERCHVWDQCGQPVAFERLLVFIAAAAFEGNPPGRTVALDRGISRTAAAGLAALGARTVPCGHLRAETHRIMVEREAGLGFDSAGRIWYAAGGHVAADALATLALLLNRLSRDDRPLSEVLDEEVPGH